MNLHKIGWFLLLTFGISWLSAFIPFYWLDMNYGQITATVIVAVLFMPAPAYATLIVQKLIYKEEIIQPLRLTLKNISYKWLLLLPLFLIVFLWGTVGVCYLGTEALGWEVFGKIDLSAAGITTKIEQIAVEAGAPEGAVSLSALPFEMNGLNMFLITLGASIIAAISVNLPFMLGEELGWRGLLIKEIQSLGFWKSNLLIGLIWGIWHAPVIYLGHNYPGHNSTGVLVMVLFTIPMAYLMAYFRFKSKTVLGPAIFHGLINGSAQLVLIYLHGNHLLFGNPAGVAGIVVLVLMVIGIPLFDKNFIREYQGLP